MSTIDAKDVISAAAIVFSASLAVLGWLVAAHKDRHYHLFQRRVEKRIWMLENVLQVVLPLMNYSAPFDSDPELREKLSRARFSVQLFAYEDEQSKFEELVSALEARDVQRTRKSLDALVPAIRMKLRTEMGYET